MVYLMNPENRLIEITGDIIKKIVSGYSPQKIILSPIDSTHPILGH